MIMDNTRVYLKQNALAEPLFNQWYAWPYLIPPHTAAMYIANWHLTIMKSFVKSPQIHVAAVKDPAMIGGPFMNCDPGRTDSVNALMEKTLKGQGDLLRLATAIKDLDEMLLKSADGYSMESLYQEVPDMLKGYVELTYDLNNQPSLRFIEGLLYRSPYYDPSLQSIELSLINYDERPFVFSTPRLEEEGHLRVNLPFNSGAIDELFKMRFEPGTLGHIREALGIKDEDLNLFASFFTEEEPRPYQKYEGEGVRVRYFGHACILIESKHTTIMCDPLISYNYPAQFERYTYADLPPSIDYALITHNHQDHCLFEHLLQMRHKIKTLVIPKTAGGGLADPSLKLILQNIGFNNVREIDEMESIPVDGGSITGLPFLGEHADLGIRAKTAYLINLNNQTMLCAADSNNLEPKLYEHIHDCFADLDVLFIGMECVGAPLTWLYGPLLTRPLARKMDQSRRFSGSNCQKGADIVDRFKPQQVYVYAMGHEPWLTFLSSIEYTAASPQIIESNKLVQACRERGIVSERLLYQKELFLGESVNRT